MSKKEYEEISENGIRVFKKVDDFIRKYGCTPCEHKRRYERCEKCKWYIKEREVCDHCGYGYPYYDYNGMKPYEVSGKCDIFVEKKEIKKCPTCNQDIN